MNSLSLLIGILFFLPIVHAGTPAWTVKVTSYNAERSQTDASPCIGAGLVDLCQRAREGGRTIALSRDLVSREGKTPFRYHDIVRLHNSAPPQCDGEYIVLDTMNERFTRRADIFFLDRSQNTSCVGKISKIGNALR